MSESEQKMRVLSFASGSKGNCTLVSLGETHVLVDAGISATRIERNLRSQGIAPSELSAILVTHEHSDHVKGLSVLSKRWGVPVLCSAGTAGFLHTALDANTRDCVGTIRAEYDVALGDITVRAFATPHDTPESFGFRLEGGGEAVAVCTDLGHVSESVMENLRGVDGIVLEANHDLDMLRYGKYPHFLKLRIRSDLGHLSNDCAALIALRLAESGTRSFMLAHLSDENNTPRCALETVGLCLEREGLVLGRDVSLTVAGVADVRELTLGFQSEVVDALSRSRQEPGCALSD